MTRARSTIAIYVTAALGRRRLPSMRCDEGQTLAEYGLILAFVMVIVAVALPLLGTDISSMFSKISAGL